MNQRKLVKMSGKFIYMSKISFNSLCIFTKITDLGYFGKATKNSDAIFVNQNILFLDISKII